MEVFSDERPIEREPVNIHVVLDHVNQIAARPALPATSEFVELYDPSLPPVSPTRTS
jgi:two-component system nitrogen regulation sensor histidine kinase GlnL